MRGRLTLLERITAPFALRPGEEPERERADFRRQTASHQHRPTASVLTSVMLRARRLTPPEKQVSLTYGL